MSALDLRGADGPPGALRDPRRRPGPVARSGPATRGAARNGAGTGLAGGVQEFHQQLGRVLAEVAPGCSVADSEAAVNAAAAAAAGGDTSPERSVGAMGDAIEDVARSVRFPHDSSQAVSWRGFGALIPVLAGSAGAGASSVAAATTDALQQAGRCALLVDADDPCRSGLAGAAAEEGPWLRRVGQHIRVRYSWREEALVARLETNLPALTPGMVPAPPSWLPDPAPEPLHATVVDLGHGGWRVTADPLYGAGGWLRRGAPSQRPLLVVRATRPSLRQAEQLVARLDPWVACGAASPPYQLVVNCARRWPAGVVGAAGPRLEQLLDDAVFVPHDDGWEIGGISEHPSPRRAVAALTELLARWGVLGDGPRP